MDSKDDPTQLNSAIMVSTVVHHTFVIDLFLFIIGKREKEEGKENNCLVDNNNDKLVLVELSKNLLIR